MSPPKTVPLQPPREVDGLKIGQMCDEDADSGDDDEQDREPGNHDLRPEEPIVDHPQRQGEDGAEDHKDGQPSPGHQGMEPPNGEGSGPEISGDTLLSVQ